MTKAPLPETVRLIARILKSRPTDQEEVPSLISAVQRTIEQLNGRDEARHFLLVRRPRLQDAGNQTDGLRQGSFCH